MLIRLSWVRLSPGEPGIGFRFNRTSASPFRECDAARSRSRSSFGRSWLSPGASVEAIREPISQFEKFFVSARHRLANFVGYVPPLLASDPALNSQFVRLNLRRHSTHCAALRLLGVLPFVALKNSHPMSVSQTGARSHAASFRKTAPRSRHSALAESIWMQLSLPQSGQIGFMLEYESPRLENNTSET